MNENVAKALEESIAHWERLADNRALIGEGIFSEDCPLCALFIRGPNHSCRGCPVMLCTGYPDCAGSPWREVFATTYSLYPSQSEPFLKAAAKMRDFMISLRPTGTTPAPSPH